MKLSKEKGEDHSSTRLCATSVPKRRELGPPGRVECFSCSQYIHGPNLGCTDKYHKKRSVLCYCLYWQNKQNRAEHNAKPSEHSISLVVKWSDGRNMFMFSFEMHTPQAFPSSPHPIIFIHNNSKNYSFVLLDSSVEIHISRESGVVDCSATPVLPRTA